MARRTVSHPAPPTYMPDGYPKLSGGDNAAVGSGGPIKTKIVVEDFSSKESGGKLNMPPHCKTTDA